MKKLQSSMKPPHKHFFSSLKQLEKRLKLDDRNPPPPLPKPQTETQLTESSNGSPLYFHNQHTNTSSTLHLTNSVEQPPQEFLSNNNIIDFPPNPDKPPPQIQLNKHSAVGDNVESMIELLRLSDINGKAAEIADVAGDEFYDKIVKVKGPKCKKEAERLDNWINYYLLNNGGGDGEPLRLAHLLMAKAAFVSDGGDGLEFPSTVDEFLQSDPPSD